VPGTALRWRLTGRNGWGAALSTGGAGVRVVAKDVLLGAEAITLGHRPGGAASSSGNPASVGSLTLPASLHDANGELLLASGRRGRILRFDGATRSFRSWIGLGSFVERGSDAPEIALTRSGELLVLGERGRSALLALHPGGPVVYDLVALDGRFVVDLETVGSGKVLILAQVPSGPAEIWSWRPGAAAPSLCATLPPAVTEPETKPKRLLTDRSRRIWVFDEAGERMLSLPPDQGTTGWRPLAEVRERFAPIRVVIEPDPRHGWRLRVPPAGTEPPFSWPAPPGWPAFSPEGRALSLPPEAPVGLPPFVAEGSWTVGPLDGAIPRFVWDRFEIELAKLPDGSAVEIQTRTSDDPAEPEQFSTWSSRYRVTTLPAPGSDPGLDFAVLSPPGRYLWLRVRLTGGSGTPEVGALTAAGPRGGLVEFLPAVFRETDQDTRFLERFVGALERSWEPLEQSVGEFHRELRAETASSASMLEFLASWFDEPVQPEWSMEARRHTVRHGGKYLFRRGTPEGMRAALRLFLANRWGLPPDALETPFLWEHFRSRLPLHAGSAGATGSGVGRLFGSEILHRLRLGASALGTGTLRNLGSPETDPVTLDAHRYTVFVPRALLPTADDLRGFHNVLVREQPVHAMGDVVLIEPRFRVGVQSTLGVDSVLGVYPAVRLGSACRPDDPDGARLEYDTLLAAETDGSGSLTRLDRDGGTLPWRIT
jgi:phage tail-like protein